MVSAKHAIGQANPKPKVIFQKLASWLKTLSPPNSKIYRQIIPTASFLLRFQLHNKQLVLFGIHAPTLQTDPKERDKFYIDQHRLIQKVPADGNPRATTHYYKYYLPAEGQFKDNVDAFSTLSADFRVWWRWSLTYVLVCQRNVQDIHHTHVMHSRMPNRSPSRAM
ncbi:hypothetical protein LOAG_05883 [Loa loa]|uniref:Uncharacterized protein n=1 Tax=Loa loa TaxID=7209 RepID=A0A1I7VZZ4_LOALO|nr:hypothetical protein LOAG_05883 [Loa loa]EFO22599.2 hypothetical protein LOAG_05883 [Loa loa]